MRIVTKRGFLLSVLGFGLAALTTAGFAGPAPLSDAELDRIVGSVCPHCDNCANINDTFFECLHRGQRDPCDNTRCIENIMNTDACTLVPTEGPDNCNTSPTVPAASAIRQIGRTHPCNSTVGWHVWRVRYVGKTTCTGITTRVRCDHATCTGTPFEPDSFVGVRHSCGC